MSLAVDIERELAELREQDRETALVRTSTMTHIVWAPEPMLKSIAFGPEVPLESRIACRSEPAPLSFVLVTEKVEGSHRISRSWKLGR